MEISIRKWQLTDVDNLIANANNENIARFMTDQFPHPFTIEKGKSFIEKVTTSTPTNIYAIDYNGIAVGGIGIHLQQDISKNNAELGYWLGEKYWNKGLITKAIKLITEQAFKDFEINRIFARPFGSNIASQRVLEKSGFKLEARFSNTFIKNGVLEDELIYAIRKS